ncbi:MAG: 3-isopropylmalate dehydratase [Hadesarchaea archaeon DG-33-1]|nr:MAG: 3-isopropylmalate dehydratase [Hadesarchaea archaeon DG-33-1]
MARAWVFGDDIDTDQIIAGRYLVKLDPRELAKHVMEAADPKFASEVRRGDVIIAGHNFGCGSSRERAPLALKAAGISAVVAESFARIFYRNAVNLGLPVLTCSGASMGFKTGNKVRVGMREGKVHNLSTGKTFKFEPLPDFLLEIVRAGGLLQHMKKRRATSK